MTVAPLTVHDLRTPALVLDADALDHNLSIMAERLPGRRLRPHVKAHKTTRLAMAQREKGHDSFTCATIREMEGMVQAGLGADLLLANEVADVAGVQRLTALLQNEGEVRITLAVDSDATVDAAIAGGIRDVVIDVNIGLPRCGCEPDDAARLADRARAGGVTVRGVMGYEGHLMMVMDPTEQRERVEASMALLLRAAREVGGELISAGGTGTHLANSWANEIQAGSYALMDTQYAEHSFGFQQALSIVGSVISVSPKGWAVADVGLKAQGMDHGLPRIESAKVWFCSDEHVTYAPSLDNGVSPPRVGERVRVIPAHCDPTVAYHDKMWLVRGETVIDCWPVDLRGW